MADLKALNEKLADFPYVSGYTPSQDDVKELAAVGEQDLSKFKNVLRWRNHLKTWSEAEKKSWPGAPAPKPAAAKPAGGDDDDLDLFGDDDDEEAEKAKAERAKELEAKKKGDKPAVIAKSSVVLDIKVYDDETDLDQVEKEVRKIVKDGLLWGTSKKVPVAFGMYKLQIVCVVEDDKVSVDWLSETIEEIEDVQSTDIAAFQKI